MLFPFDAMRAQAENVELYSYVCLLGMLLAQSVLQPSVSPISGSVSTSSNLVFSSRFFLGRGLGAID